MSDHVYKKIEITGTSSVGQDDAIRQAIKRASETVKDMSWFEVVDSRGRIKDGKIEQFQVTLKIGFKLKDWTLAKCDLVNDL